MMLNQDHFQESMKLHLVLHLLRVHSGCMM
nr:MAG TPA: hypothetical protein [Caudoviricetes sp.]